MIWNTLEEALVILGKENEETYVREGTELYGKVFSGSSGIEVIVNIVGARKSSQKHVWKHGKGVRLEELLQFRFPLLFESRAFL